jgi:hypothetical protein
MKIKNVHEEEYRSYIAVYTTLYCSLRAPVWFGRWKWERVCARPLPDIPWVPWMGATLVVKRTSQVNL